MESLGDTLKRKMEQRGLGKVALTTIVLENANRILPPAIRAKTYHDGLLRVETGESSQAYFFKQECETYQELINASLPNPVVTKIVIRINHT